jgi:hypothetical protein
MTEAEREATLKEQAEISFKAGYKAGLLRAAEIAESKQWGYPDHHKAEHAEHNNQNVCVRNSTAREIADAIRKEADETRDS